MPAPVVCIQQCDQALSCCLYSKKEDRIHRIQLYQAMFFQVRLVSLVRIIFKPALSRKTFIENPKLYNTEHPNVYKCFPVGVHSLSILNLQGVHCTYLPENNRSYVSFQFQKCTNVVTLSPVEYKFHLNF